jgi:ABC-type methionine transport system ATPase subunit
MGEPIIKLENVSKTFSSLNGEVEAVRNIDLTIEKGDIFGIIGLSGAGKSTLVRCLNLLERPTEGKVYVDGKDMMSLSNRELAIERRDIGMIFQHFNLLMQRNVLDNVAFPLEIAGEKRAAARKKAEKYLHTVGLSEKADAYPAQLSGGQKQRVAIARAMVNSPKILLADEPTGALDSKSGIQVMGLFEKLHNEGVTIVMITHAREIAEYADRIITIFDGQITSDEINKNKVVVKHSDNTSEVNAAQGNSEVVKGTNEPNIIEKILNADSIYDEFEDENSFEAEESFEDYSNDNGNLSGDNDGAKAEGFAASGVNGGER